MRKGIVLIDHQQHVCSNLMIALLSDRAIVDTRCGLVGCANLAIMPADERNGRVRRDRRYAGKEGIRRASANGRMP